MSGISCAARLCAVAAVSVAPVSAQATLNCPFPDGNGTSAGACIEGQGTWQTSLQPRDFGNDGIIDAYYDPVLDLTWLADVTQPGVFTFSAANAWASSLNTVSFLGGTSWRLPTVTPVNGSALNTSYSEDGSTDVGYANTGVGWGAASEMGYMYYVHLGNAKFGPLTNTGPFSNLQNTGYWTDRDFGGSTFPLPIPPTEAIAFQFNDGEQVRLSLVLALSTESAWAVHPGDLIGPSVCPFADGNGPSAGRCTGQGTWQTSLEPRDFGNDGTIDAYYDPVLDLTWLADANYAQTSGFDADGRLTFNEANAGVALLGLFGGTDWRLPTVTPVNGSTFDTSYSENGSTDRGYAQTGVGWGAASELGYMYYVHLGNAPFGPLTNTGPFENLLPDFYWTDRVSGPSFAWNFLFGLGNQRNDGSRSSGYRVWPVHPGDLIGPPPAPEPQSVPLPWVAALCLAGVLGLSGVRGRRR
jgi:hypothetical protein